MERLTVNKAVSEMNVIELAHNSCYGKDGKARCRNYETDIDAREFAIKLLEKYADIPNEFTCDDDFDDFMLDSLQYGADTILGLIAVFYQNLWAMANLRGRLKEYEDLEEQEKLLKLPCAVGDTVWELCKCDDDIYRIFPMTVTKVLAYGSVRWIKGKEPDVWNVYAVSDYTDMYKNFYDFGKTVFLTEEQAQAALHGDQ